MLIWRHSSYEWWVQDWIDHDRCAKYGPVVWNLEECHENVKVVWFHTKLWYFMFFLFDPFLSFASPLLNFVVGVFERTCRWYLDDVTWPQKFPISRHVSWNFQNCGQTKVIVYPNQFLHLICFSENCKIQNKYTILLKRDSSFNRETKIRNATHWNPDNKMLSNLDPPIFCHHFCFKTLGKMELWKNYDMLIY